MGRLAGDSPNYTFSCLNQNGEPTDVRFELPSSTTIIKKVLGSSGGGMAYWGFKLGIQSQHPKTTPDKIEELYSRAKWGPYAPNKQRDSAGDRGTFAHWVAEKAALGFTVATDEDGKTYKLEIDNLELDGYSRAALKWLKDHGIPQPQLDVEPYGTVYAVEKTVYSLKHGFAGTADLLIKSHRQTFSDSGLWPIIEVVDWKTHKPAKGKHPAYFDDLLQLSSYSIAIEEMGGCSVYGTRVVILQEDGNYLEDDRWVCEDVFLKVLDVYREMQEVS